MATPIVDDLPQSPIMPVQLGLDDQLQFDCHKGIGCFNKCCQNIDIQLTPYDILRLKNHLGLSSQEFLHLYTVPFEMDAHGVPGIKLKTAGEESTACQLLTPEGCGVYEDRPSACRYYALGLVSMRKTGSSIDEDNYFVVKESHCLGHNEPKVQTIRQYRKEQGVDLYDELNREWRQIILKKRSCGPTIGTPSLRSMQLFFMASYDVDGFREFVNSASFNDVYDIDSALKEEINSDEVKLMQFGFRFLKQVLFGEQSIPVKPDAMSKRIDRLRARQERQKELAGGAAQLQDEKYNSID